MDVVHGTGPVAPPPAAPPQLSIDTTCRGDGENSGGEANDEPLSPTALMFRDLYIVAVIGLATPINFDATRAGLEATLVRHPRFSSIRVMDGPEPRWVRTMVNLDDHIVVPDLDPVAVSANPDEVLEDYVASLSTLPMNLSRPLWEIHALDFPTSEAASALVFRIHHALGDGTSLISLLLACTRSVANPGAPPTMLPPPSARRPAYHGLLPTALVAWVVSWILLALHTVMDVAHFVALALRLVSDPRTVFTGVKGVEFRPKRFVNRTLSLDDVKHVRRAVGCTVNDVLVGVTSLALSRYYFRKQGDHSTDKGNTCIRSAVFVNIRPTSGIQKLSNMMESGSRKDWKWGNKIGYIFVPFEIVMHDDPLDFIRKAKRTMDRKKHSLQAIISHVVTKIVIKLFGIEASIALFYRMISSTTVQFSNMSGPVEPTEFYGHPVVYIAPGVFGHPSALTIHWQSYVNKIKIILSVDDAQFPDCHQLIDDFAESLEIMRDAASTAMKEIR